MELLKKNIISIICGLVAVLAIGAYFWPLGEHTAKLDAKVKSQVGQYDELARLLSRPRKLPIIPGAGPQRDLTVFPSQAIIDAGRKAVAEVASQAKSMRDWAVAANKHEPLLKGCLPNVSDKMAFDFRDLYNTRMGREPDSKFPRMLPADLKPGAPPTDDDIAAAAEKVRTGIMDRIEMGPNGQPALGAQRKAERQVKDQLATLPEQLRRVNAQQCRIYVDADAMDTVSLSTKAVGGTITLAPPAGKIWAAQLSYWVQQDILNAIVELNRDAESVQDSPFKRLVKIAVDTSYVRPPKDKAKDAPSGNLMQLPGPMNPMGAESMQQQNFGTAVLSPTGRTCNALYDVVQFSIDAEVDAARIPAVIQGLERGKFINVFSVDVASIDATQAAALDGYIYGDAPVARVLFRGETIMFRAWTVPLMPRSVRTYLNVGGK
jgi:hypothetical protein